MNEDLGMINDLASVEIGCKHKGMFVEFSGPFLLDCLLVLLPRAQRPIIPIADSEPRNINVRQAQLIK
jgi:hypothetical protein